MITLNGTTSAAATTVTLPTHASGDVLVIVASSASNIGPPRPYPAGWTQIVENTSSNGTVWAAYKVAASGSETSGTWSNGNGSASELIAWSFSGADTTDPIGVTAASSVLNGSTISFDALTLQVTDGSSWVVRAGYVRSTVPDLSAATVTGYTFRQNPINGASSQALGIDSGGGVASVSAQTVALGASYQRGDINIEILASGGGGPTVARRRYRHDQLLMEN